jgi:hypothetical protein
MNPLSDLTARVDRDRLAHESVGRIRRELPAYGSIPLAEHLAAVAGQQGNQLDAIGAGRVVAGHALAEAAELARLRARQNVDVEVVIGAYHLGDQVLWQALVEASDADTAAVLPRAASLLLGSLHALSAALTAAHAEASQALQSRRITASQRLFELLVGGRVDAETRRHADILGLRPEDHFVAVAALSQLDDESSALAHVLASRLERAGGTVVAGDGALTWVLCQGLSAGRVGATLADVALPAAAAGVGLERPGLVGAAASLGDARLAVLADRSLDAGVGSTGLLRVASFEEVWPQACVSREMSRLEPVLASAVAVALRHPHLAEAVRAFARGDMHVARSAKLINLHANSLGYRLDRWSALTGWDPRTFAGLVRSVAAVDASAGRASAKEGGASVELLDEAQA